MNKTTISFNNDNPPVFSLESLEAMKNMKFYPPTFVFTPQQKKVFDSFNDEQKAEIFEIMSSFTRN